MKNASIVRRSLGDRRRGRTDWARVDALTDNDIAKAVADDPDAAPVDINWTQAELAMPEPKKLVSIRLDQDLLDFFKAEGRGYQTRINQVLRAYMNAKAG